MPDEPSLIRKLTHEQARAEQRLYWSTKSIPERLAASAALTQRMNAMRGIKTNDGSPDFTPSRIPRTKR